MLSANRATLNLNAFVATERRICESAFQGIRWDDDAWPILHIDPAYRGKPFDLVFKVMSQAIVGRDVIQPQPKSPLPSPYREFCKALIIHFRRTLGVGARALFAYLNEAKRLYNVMSFRSESSPVMLKNYHFQYLHDYLDEIEYKQIYDATTTLAKISSVIDTFGISVSGTAYKTTVRPQRQHYGVKFREQEPDGKEFSREALEGYALATNNPQNEGEEILLRTIDLLLAMGQRCNEVTHIPLDCWVERTDKDAQGREIVNPVTQEPIQTFGIRYYAEKHSESRVHWLADQDVPFAFRAVTRLKELTAEARAVAIFQRKNPGRIWTVPREQYIDWRDISSHFSFAGQHGLQQFLTKIGVTPVSGTKKSKSAIYLAGDVEDAILSHKRLGAIIKTSVALADSGGKPVLHKDDLLALAFDGAFRMKRKDHLLKVVVGKLSVIDINCALGADPKRESVFDRRGITEADGSRIVMTSHMPRHWRNTLYEIAGMSEVQQALALGRADLSQNRHYQHATVEEKNALLHEFIKTRNPTRRLEIFKEGVRNGNVRGSVADTYHRLKERSPVHAESFLEIHVMAAHVTPYGVCAHDFSKAPCPKHLQCFDSCGHLHRTDNPREVDNLGALIKIQERNICRMKECGCGDAGADTWIEVEERKLSGMRKARDMVLIDHPQRVFPNGKKVNQPRRRSAVRED